MKLVIFDKVKQYKNIMRKLISLGGTDTPTHMCSLISTIVIWNLTRENVEIFYEASLDIVLCRERITKSISFLDIMQATFATSK